MTYVSLFVGGYVLGWVLGYMMGYVIAIERVKAEFAKIKAKRTSLKDLYPDKYDQNN